MELTRPCVADGTTTEGQAKMLLQLLLYPADALMELATLQCNVTEHIGVHLAAAERLWALKCPEKADAQ